MVEAKALIFRLDRKVDRLHGEGTRQISIVDMCSALTEAQRFLAKDRVQKIEQDKRYRYELRQIEVKEHKIDIDEANKGKVSKIKLPDDIYRDLAIRIIATKRGCGRKEIALTKLESGDKDRSLDNPFWKSSFAWEQAFGDEAGGFIYVYNGTDFKVEGMIIDYIIQPPEIHCPSKVISPDQYIDWNGKVQNKDQGWVLDDLVDEGINLSALMLTSDIGDFRDFQRQLNNNLQTEQTSKL